VSARLSIGDFSRMTFLSVKALRHYHELGLLAPAEIDPESGYRRYDVAQVPTAQAIRRLRELGMPLDDVRAVIEAPDLGARNAAIGEHLRRMEGELERTRATVESLRLLLGEDAPAPIAVEYRTVEPASLAVRGEIDAGDLHGWLDRAFAELYAAVREQAVRRAGVDGGLYSSELLEEERGEVVAFVPVGADARPAGRVEALTLPAGEYAVAVHRGSFENLDRTYAALGAVVAERELGVRGPIRENYLVGGADTPDESEHRTEVCWPVFQTTPAD
jgi:DNA-binding transcriptional MerR regulator